MKACHQKFAARVNDAVHFLMNKIFFRKSQKMKLIAHRGLVGGPDKSLENRPDVVLDTLSAGFDCEVDLWIVDDRLYLGHDRPQHNVTIDFIATSGLWIHAKSLATLAWLAKIPYALNYFWHHMSYQLIHHHLF